MSKFPIIKGKRFWPFRLNEICDLHSEPVLAVSRKLPDEPKPVCDWVIREVEYPFHLGRPDDLHTWNAYHGKYKRCYRVDMDFWDTASEVAVTRVGDCLTPDTPVVVWAGHPRLVEMADLMPRDWPIGVKYHPRDLHILCGHHNDAPSSSLVFRPINWVVKKRAKTNFARIKTGRSIFDVTKDHLILCWAGKFGDGNRGFLTPLDAREKRASLWTTEKPFKIFDHGGNLFSCQDHDVAWLYGLFCAEGSCSPSGYWRIWNTDERLLERAKEIMEETMVRRTFRVRSLTFEIVEREKEGVKTNLGVRNKPLLSLEARAKRSGKGCKKARGSLMRLIEVFRGRCYTSGGRKKVPDVVLHGSERTARGFIDGFNAGDAGTNTSKILMFGLGILHYKIGEPFSIHDHGKNMEIRHGDTAKKRASSWTISMSLPRTSS